MRMEHLLDALQTTSALLLSILKWNSGDLSAESRWKGKVDNYTSICGWFTRNRHVSISDTL